MTHLLLKNISNERPGVVDGMEYTRDFHFPPRIKAEISEYASNYAVSNYA